MDVGSSADRAWRWWSSELLRDPEIVGAEDGTVATPWYGSIATLSVGLGIAMLLVLAVFW